MGERPTPENPSANKAAIAEDIFVQYITLAVTNI